MPLGNYDSRIRDREKSEIANPQLIKVVTCPKCGSSETKTDYCNGMETHDSSVDIYGSRHITKAWKKCGRDQHKEHLVRTCTCGYAWQTPCLDALKEKDEEAEKIT